MASSSNNLTTCFDFSGTAWPNSTLCPNTDVCCPNNTLCTSKHLCNSTIGTLERPTCNNFPWTNSCSPICHYESAANLLPAVEVCEDGSYCCDNDPQCCAKQIGINLNANGGVISTQTGPPASSTFMAIPATSIPNPIITPTATLPATINNNALYTPSQTAGLVLISLTLAALTLSNILLCVYVGRNRRAVQALLEHKEAPRSPVEIGTPSINAELGSEVVKWH